MSYLTYKVVKGDTLWGISRKYGTTIDAIYNLNRDKIKNKNLIYVGQVLNIKEEASSSSNGNTNNSSQSTSSDRDPNYIYYTVVRGDTLWDISQTYKTTVKILQNLNNIANPNLIQIGLVLKIPKNGSSSSVISSSSSSNFNKGYYGSYPIIEYPAKFNANDVKDSSSYIREIQTNTWIPLPIIPEEISDSNTATFSPIDIIGRSSPLQGYQSSGPRTVSFSLKLHEDLICLNKSNPWGTPNLYLKQLVAYLKSLTYPEYGTTIKSPEVILVIGNTIGIHGVPTNCSVTWSGPYNIAYKTYKSCTVQLDITETTDDPYSASKIFSSAERSGGYLL